MRKIIGVMMIAGVSACASMERGQINSYSEELEQLTEDCRARGGILQPTARSGSARPQEDYVCRLTGGPSERLQRPGG